MNHQTQLPTRLKLSKAWEQAGREAGLWEKWRDIHSLIAEAERQRPLLPLDKKDLVQLFGDEWKAKRNRYEEERDALLGPLTARRAYIREEIHDAFRKRMLSCEWQASGRPDDPVAAPVNIEPEVWSYFDLGAVHENCVIFPKYFRRSETRKFIYSVVVRVGSIVADEAELQSSVLRVLVRALEKQILPQRLVFDQQADFVREINHHLARSVENSAKHLNLPLGLKSLSDDRRLAVLQHFLKIMLPELGSDLLGKFALEILEKKLLSDGLDSFDPETFPEIAGLNRVRQVS